MQLHWLRRPGAGTVQRHVRAVPALKYVHRSFPTSDVQLPWSSGADSGHALLRLAEQDHVLEAPHRHVPV